MSTPTPADVYGPRRAQPSRYRSHTPPLFFAAAGADRRAQHEARRRVEARDEALAAAEHLARELARLRGTSAQRDLDLRMESYRRAADRLDTALDAFDEALADPACPPIPAPTARGL